MLPQFPIISRRTVVGGYASTVMDLAHKQSDLGHSVRIVSRLPSQYSYEGPVQIQGLHTAATPSRAAPAAFVAAAAQYVLKSKSEVNIFHFHSGYIEYLVAAIGAKLLTANSLIAHTIYCPPQEGIRRLEQHALAMAASRLGIHLGGMSNYVTERLGHMARWTPPIIDTDYLARRDPAGRPQIKLLFVGNAMPDKGLVDLLKAYMILAQRTPAGGTVPKLTVTTELDRTSTHKTVSAAVADLEELGLADNVTWLSIVSNMRALLQDHDIHVAPFRTTNGPSDYFVSTLEAMSTGMICIVSDLPGMSEVIQDGTNGYSFRAGRADSLAQALLKAMSGSDRELIGDAARQTIVNMSQLESDPMKLYEIGVK